MEPKDYLEILQELADARRRDFPYAGSKFQKMTVAILFNEFADLADIGTEFAVPEREGDWFRKQCLSLIFNKDSMNELTSGELSMLIDEFGHKVGGVWQLTTEGKRGLFSLVDLVAERNPRQVRMSV